MSQDCPGACNLAARKSAAIYQAALAAYDQALEALADGEPVPDPPEPPVIRRPWQGDPVWCGKCTARIRLALAELDELASRLATLPPGVRPASDSRREQVRVRVSRATPSPSQSGDDLDELQSWLLAWEGEYRRLRSWPSSPPRGILASTLTASAAWLVTHLDGILASPFAAEFGEETLRWHAEIRAKTHASSFMRHVPRPCPPPPSGCGRYTLWEKAGEDSISCLNADCNRVLTHDDLDRFAAAS